MRVEAHDDALRADAFDALVAFVRAHVALVDAGEDPTNASGGWDDAPPLVDDVDAPRAIGALTSSYWCPRKAFDAPRCAVEAVIGGLARSSATRGACATATGAEWWIQDVASDEPPKVYHTDCDVMMMDGGTSVRSHPALASVLYVEGGEGGGATCVFDQTTSRAADGELEPRAPASVCACGVRENRFLVFDGDRWHGVLRNEDGFRGQRVTVLVNWWTSRPAGARTLPRRFVDEKSPRVAELGAMTRVEPVVLSRGSYADDAACWDEQRLPAGASARAGDVVEFRYASA